MTIQNKSSKDVVSKWKKAVVYLEKPHYYKIKSDSNNYLYAMIAKNSNQV